MSGRSVDADIVILFAKIKTRDLVCPRLLPYAHNFRCLFFDSFGTKARLRLQSYVSGPTKKILQRSIFFVAKSTGSDRKRQVASDGARVVHGFFVTRTCAKTRRSRGNVGRAAMFRKRVKLSEQNVWF